MRVDIVIIGAMEPEVEGLISEMSDKTVEIISGIAVNLGKIGEKQVAVAKCGIGKVFAALCAEALIIKYSPSLIVNTGVGGALAKDLKTGDIVIAESLCQHDMDTSAIGDPVGLVSGINKIYFDADKRASQILLEAAKSLGLTAREGRVASGDKFIASAEDKLRITKEFSADVCEMEGCAIAQVAFVNNIPFAVVRAISDSADGGATMDYPTFLPIAAANSQKMTMALIEKWQ
ncbi:MAG: 5'-methylthioadenosine/adenosylhomocysteine nucleosidase [Clostridia bacterium]|nr:5'-methylthioadenosine/adenosylhomocysteine nucleosidase [Clostridia bacterium]MBO5315324.1 5'-methylthioadenosine/adenosylhomocysteine nucleosidase [Clostridia bacterium]